MRTKTKSAKTSLMVVLLVCFLVALVSGCIVSSEEEGKYGVGVVFSSSEKVRPGQPDPGVKGRYQVSPHTAFTGTYTIDNDQPKGYQYLVMALLDYQQAPLTLAGRKLPYHLLDLDASEKKSYSFATQPIEPGFHDFTIVAFREPRDHSLKKDFRWDTDVLFYRPQRANLLVGDNQSVSPTPSAGGKIVKGNDQLDGILLKKGRGRATKVWPKEKVSVKSRLDYFIHLGNTSSKKVTFAVMVFLDYQQIPARGSGPLTLFGQLGPKEKVVIPARLVAPRKKGVHELFALWAVNPFAQQKEDPQAAGDDRMESTIRTAIVVK